MLRPDPLPPRVTDRYLHWNRPPRQVSDRCHAWAARIAAGWKRNRRIGMMGYDAVSEWFGVYIWEWLNVLAPLLQRFGG